VTYLVPFAIFATQSLVFNIIVPYDTQKQNFVSVMTKNIAVVITQLQENDRRGCYLLVIVQIIDFDRTVVC
jgi:hypothetical protein